MQFALVVSAQAQFQSAGTINYIYSEKIDQSTNISPLGDDLFGDSTNNETGATTFSVTDIKAATNVHLPVQLGRVLTVPGSSTSYTYKYNPLSDIFGLFWSADVPYIQNDSLADFGWLDSGGRCSGGNFSIDAKNVNEIVVYAHNFFFGNDISIPAYGKERLLTLLAGGLKPTDGATYVGTTKSNWKVSCLPTIKNGPGEGFVVTLPDGAKYYFDWMARAPTGYIETAEGVLNLQRVRLYATKAVDRFGGTVQYTYDTTYPHRITQIKSSDGATITVAYNSTDGKVASASLGARTWKYVYATSSGDWDNLSTVTLPDGSTWSYSTPPYGVDGRVGLNLCEFTVGTRTSSQAPGPNESHSFHIVHPSGAIGDFSFRAIMFGYNRTPTECGPGDYIPKAYIGNALYVKSISGPGLPTKTWNISYYPSWSYASECTSGCATTASTVVTENSGRKTTYVFGNDYSTNAGQLVSKTTSGSSGGSSVEKYTYLANATGQPFPDAIGQEKYTFSNPFLLKNRPVASRTITQDGVTFSRVINSFDAYVNPTSITKSSTGSAAGNSSRTETTTYFQDTIKWVVGRVATVTDQATGIQTSRTDYTAMDLPWHNYRFGLLKHTFSYYTDGTVSTMFDGNGTTNLANYKGGIPQSIHYPVTPDSSTGATISAVVNDSGWVTSTTDEMGFTTSYGYDAMGRLNQITYPAADTVAWNNAIFGFTLVNAAEFGIPAGHWKHTATNGTGKITTYYDALWRPVLVRSEDTANAATVRFVVKRYDTDGHEIFSSYPVASLTSVNDALTGTRTFYDTLGRVTRVEQDSELGVLASTTQYLTGFKSKITNPRGFSTTTTYRVYETPSTDLPMSIVQDINLSPLDQVTTSITRDVFGSPTALTRSGTFNAAAIISTRKYVYDSNERLCKVINPESGATLMDYDGASNLAWSADGSSLTTLTCDRASVLAADKTTRSYDARNRLLTTTYPGTTTGTSYAYFADGALKTLTSGSASWDYTYNKRRMPVTEKLTLGARISTITHGYNAMGFPSSLTYPSGLSVAITPNGLGQATQAGTYATGVTYWPNGGMKGFIYGNLISHSLTQNTRQQPDRSVDQKAGSLAVLDDSYDYDSNGNVAAITDGLAGAIGNRNMTYDGLDRLTRTTAPNQVWVAASTSYDPLGNIRNNTVGSRNLNYSYNSNFQLTQMATPVNVLFRSFAWDARGNITGNGTTTNVFDRANRLTSVTGKESYLYDGYGRRVQITRLSDNKISYPIYALDGKLVTEEDQRSGKTTDYVYLNGSLVAKRSAPIGTTTWSTFYEHTDALGSPVTETSASGIVQRNERYTPYGEPADGVYAQGPGFTGHVTDAATGLSYMQQRYYDPQIGRFLSVDPVFTKSANGANFNRYWYADNNPYRFTDPDGRESVGEMIDSGAEGCGAGSCAGWAAAKAVWTVFGAEGVSQIADKGAAASTGDKVMAGIEVATLGQGGKISAGARALTAAAKEFSPVARFSRQVAREFGAVGSPARNGSGTVFKLADGRVTVRVMESGGGRENYLRVSIEGKGSVDAAGNLSSDQAATHIPITPDALSMIKNMVSSMTQ